MAANFSYEKIQPLVASAEFWGSQVNCTFKCPITGVSAQATVDMDTVVGKVARTAVSSVKYNLMWSIRNAVTGAIWRSAGSGVLGRAATDAAYSAMDQVNTQSPDKQYSEKDKRQAVVNAFKTVAAQFRWDDGHECWLGAANQEQVQAGPQAMTEFASQLNQYPVRERYDQAVLARALVAVSCADGQFAQQEIDFLQSFVDSSLGSVEELWRRGTPSRVELEEVSPGEVRETILMIAWGVALADQNLESAESGKLGEIAEGLGIAPERAAEIRRWAQTYLLDQALRQATSDRQFPWERQQAILQLGVRIGLDGPSAERAIIQYRKRYGMV